MALGGEAYEALSSCLLRILGQEARYGACPRIFAVRCCQQIGVLHAFCLVKTHKNLFGGLHQRLPPLASWWRGATCPSSRALLSYRSEFRSSIPPHFLLPSAVAGNSFHY